MPAPYIKETARGGTWVVMYKDMWPTDCSEHEYLRCGIIAEFRSEHTARTYAHRNAAYIQHLEEVTTP